MEIAVTEVCKSPVALGQCQEFRMGWKTDLAKDTLAVAVEF